MPSQFGAPRSRSPSLAGHGPPGRAAPGRRRPQLRGHRRLAGLPATPVDVLGSAPRRRATHRQTVIASFPNCPIPRSPASDATSDNADGPMLAEHTHDYPRVQPHPPHEHLSHNRAIDVHIGCSSSTPHSSETKPAKSLTGTYSLRAVMYRHASVSVL